MSSVTLANRLAAVAIAPTFHSFVSLALVLYRLAYFAGISSVNINQGSSSKNVTPKINDVLNEFQVHQVTFASFQESLRVQPSVYVTIILARTNQLFTEWR